MKRIIATGAVIMGLFITSCSRYAYQEPSVADKNATTTVHNVNNIFN
jgi:hypothetical protein